MDSVNQQQLRKTESHSSISLPFPSFPFLSPPFPSLFCPASSRRLISSALAPSHAPAHSPWLQALSHLPDDLWDQPPPAVPLPSLDGLQLNGMPSTAPHARARRGSCCSAQDQAIASPDWDPEDSMALSARSQTSARSSTWSALSGWTDHGLTLNDSAGFADSCQESDGGPQRAEEGAPP